MSKKVLRIRDVYPGSRILIFTHLGSRISDPGSKNSNKREGWKKNCCHKFLCSHKFHKIAIYFSFEVQKKKIWANFQRIIELFTQKIVNKLSKIWVWDPGSEIRDPEKTYSGSRGQKGTGSRIRNTGQKSRIWLFRGQIRRVQKSSSSPVSINACSSNVICHVTSMQELTFKNTSFMAEHFQVRLPRRTFLNYELTSSPSVGPYSASYSL